eukprot:GHVS01072939.1.p1 GENE.GHVS01072939.1~~GHVS01072939.1.p1  ORF type:complete len:1368 (-),score=240.89 GHVS01072939.1:106-3666(-)
MFSLGQDNTGVEVSTGRALECLCDHSRHDDPFKQLVRGPACLFLLLRATNKQSTKADVCRLHKFRQHLALMDWDDVDGMLSFRDYIGLATSLRVFLACDEGQRFLSFCYVLHPTVTTHMYEILVDEVVKSSNAAVPSAYANVLYFAWKSSSGAMNRLVEDQLQGLMEHGLLTDLDTAVRFRATLEGFHKRMGDRAVTEVLVRLYEPILWRKLTVANWKVRFNAAVLLQKTFPLVDTNLPELEYQEELERTYTAVLRLAEDRHPEVRKTAVLGLCDIVGRYWEMMPADKCSAFLHTLLDKTLHDASTPAVRAATLEGIARILDNPATHKGMKPLLKKLHKCVNDTSVLVREAFSYLLCTISNVGINPTDVVPVADLTSRIVRDRAEACADDALTALRHSVDSRRVISCRRNHYAPPHEVLMQQTKHKPATAGQVANILANMLAKSIFSKTIVEQMHRCMFLADNNPDGLVGIMAELNADTVEILWRYRLAAGLFMQIGRQIKTLREKSTPTVQIQEVTTKRRGGGGNRQTTTVDVLFDPSHKEYMLRFGYILSAIRELLHPRSRHDVTTLEETDKIQNLLKDHFSEKRKPEQLALLDGPLAALYLEVLREVWLPSEAFTSVKTVIQSTLQNLVDVESSKHKYAHIYNNGGHRSVLRLCSRWKLLSKYVEMYLPMLPHIIGHSRTTSDEQTTTRPSADGGPGSTRKRKPSGGEVVVAEGTVGRRPRASSDSNVRKGEVTNGKTSGGKDIWRGDQSSTTSKVSSTARSQSTRNNRRASVSRAAACRKHDEAQSVHWRSQKAAVIFLSWIMEDKKIEDTVIKSDCQLVISTVNQFFSNLCSNLSSSTSFNSPQFPSSSLIASSTNTSTNSCDVAVVVPIEALAYRGTLLHRAVTLLGYASLQVKRKAPKEADLNGLQPWLDNIIPILINVHFNETVLSSFFTSPTPPPPTTTDSLAPCDHCTIEVGADEWAGGCILGRWERSISTVLGVYWSVIEVLILSLVIGDSSDEECDVGTSDSSTAVVGEGSNQANSCNGHTRGSVAARLRFCGGLLRSMFGWVAYYKAIASALATAPDQHLQCSFGDVYRRTWMCCVRLCDALRLTEGVRMCVPEVQECLSIMILFSDPSLPCQDAVRVVRNCLSQLSGSAEFDRLKANIISKAFLSEHSITEEHLGCINEIISSSIQSTNNNT